jgi:RNA polymerase sigma-54 factor
MAGLKLRQRLTIGQRTGLALTPAMQLSLSVLRMSPAELEAAIAAEAAENPFLLVDPAARARTMAQSAAHMPGPPPLAAAVPSLREAVMRQLRSMNLAEPIRALAFMLVGELDPDGFLPVELAQLAEELRLPVAALEPALQAIQACEPVGVGARTVSECLILQLLERGLSRADAQATLGVLSDIAARNWAAVQRALGLDKAGAQARAALLDGLRLRPHEPPEDAASPALEPDLQVERHADGHHSVHLVRAPGAGLRLDRKLIGAGGFAPELAARAQALVDALELRGRTLLRIGEWLILHQQGFLSNGTAALVPATRAAMAAELGLHPSTVGRAVAGKAIEIGGRVWPLELFFSVGPGPKAALSARAIAQRIAALVAAEPAARPLSDVAIARALNGEGVDIARRTVAKYRQGLRILPASARRQLAAARRNRTGE